jgi:hypothetical protein
MQATIYTRSRVTSGELEEKPLQQVQLEKV